MTEYNEINLDYIIQKDELGGCVAIFPRVQKVATEAEKIDSLHKLSYKSSVAEDTDSEPSVRERKQITTWWKLHQPVYAFNDRKIQRRLEKLMGSSEVRLMDTEYFTKLQKNIKQEHLEDQRRRIEKREAEELTRVKNLMLKEKINEENRELTLRNHPVFAIREKTRRDAQKLRLKVDKTKNYKTPKFSASHTECSTSKSSDDQLSSKSVDLEDIDFLLPEDQYNKMYPEDARLNELQYCKTTEELYSLADKIINSTDSAN